MVERLIDKFDYGYQDWTIKYLKVLKSVAFRYVSWLMYLQGIDILHNFMFSLHSLYAWLCVCYITDIHKQCCMLVKFCCFLNIIFCTMQCSLNETLLMQKLLMWNTTNWWIVVIWYSWFPSYHILMKLVNRLRKTAAINSLSESKWWWTYR